MSNGKWSRAFSLGLTTVSLLVAACSGNQAGGPSPSEHQDEVVETGSLALPLVASANGHVYRISLTLQVYGPQFEYISSDPYNDETEIKRTLMAGDYSAYLYDWQLYLDDGNGNLAPVSSTLVSSYYSNFTIRNNTTSTLTYDFETDGVRVSTGYGNLVVDVNVTEIAPVCTPLGSECGQGYWCPPAEFTGSPLACFPEYGQSALGAQCVSPLDCAANTSCFDFGSGPECGALCLAPDFNTPCPSGGTCVPQGVEYGVCVPDGGVDPATGVIIGPPADGGAPVPVSDGGF